MIRRPPRSTQGVSSAASDVYKRQPPRLPQPRQRGLRLLPRRFRHARHNTMVQTGRHPNDCCLRLFVRYISTRFRPTPADFIGATTAFLRPNWPHRHPAKTPPHAPTAPPPTPRATTALLRLPATSSSLTAAAATAKSPSDAGATATVVDAMTVATTSDLRRHWRPHLPPVLQQVVELPPHIPWINARDVPNEEKELLPKPAAITSCVLLPP